MACTAWFPGHSGGPGFIPPSRVRASSHELLRGERILDWEHKDPFDRILAAQAMVEGLILVTADEDLRAFGPVAALW
jgi:PIN domain nuclease of toxin-antitoxin system